MKQLEAIWATESQELEMPAPASGATSAEMAMRRTSLMAKGTVERAPAKSMALSPDATIWEPVAKPRNARETVTTSEAIQRANALCEVPEAIEVALIALMNRPVDLRYGHEAGYSQREREIAAVFAKLDVATSHVLGKRLDAGRFDDELATAFHRLTAQRRQRLRAFLADARRRVART